ncbi:MAG TPA: proteasome subunit alpha [Acidimicrobiaceae bacterium]|nr:proteasome subunit alpha [Acidimicrobiaceae bacterium]HCV34428.1 proteasome subunit alpha [Acidimicrobiaceae bacterium]
MGMPMYVSPEQLMKDRADFARKGIARGRAAVGATYSDGVLFVAENPSNTLRKVSEIYDQIGFVGVGRYNEFDGLRKGGVRHADLKGYTYSREDVDARSLANLYAEYLGQHFTHEQKPMEIELLVGEMGEDPEGDQLFHLLYDGTVMDMSTFAVIGGEADAIRARMEAAWDRTAPLASAVGHAVSALAGPERSLVSDDLEVAVLARSNGRRAFRRIEGNELDDLLS